MVARAAIVPGSSQESVSSRLLVVIMKAPLVGTIARAGQWGVVSKTQWMSAPFEQASASAGSAARTSLAARRMILERRAGTRAPPAVPCPGRKTLLILLHVEVGGSGRPEGAVGGGIDDPVLLQIGVGELHAHRGARR